MLINMISTKISYNKFLYCLALSVAAALTAFPVLVFNGDGWYPSIDFYKWVLTFSIIAYGAGTGSFMLLSGRANIQMTWIELAWLAITLLLTIQLFILPLRSFHEWLRNAYFFTALGGAVFILRNLPIDKALPGILRVITVTGGLSTLFGFIQNLTPDLKLPFILDVKGAPDRFLGNTSLDNLLGAYLALAILAGAWLLLNTKDGNKSALPIKVFDFLLLTFNCAGIWRTGTRSALIACVSGIVVLLMLFRAQPGFFKKCLKTIAIITILAISTVVIYPRILQVERRDMSKFFSAEVLSANNEGRWSIWLTSLEMIRSAPLLGVGIGNYKWNYLDAMAVFREKYHLPVRYTLWAHNEYLQWIAETGAIGGILFFSLIIYCISICLKDMRVGNNEKKPFLAWSIAALTVLMIDSCFSRPFHHVDTAFTLSLVLAMISRVSAVPVKLTPKIRFLVCGIILCISFSGIVLFSQAFNSHAYLGKYFYNPSYAAFSPFDETKNNKYPILLEDVYLHQTAREYYNRAIINIGDTEQFVQDAIRLLTRHFNTQPGYEGLNRLLLLYQKSGNTEEARNYFKYYPPEEREKFLAGLFDGQYMTK